MGALQPPGTPRPETAARRGAEKSGGRCGGPHRELEVMRTGERGLLMRNMRASRRGICWITENVFRVFCQQMQGLGSEELHFIPGSNLSLERTSWKVCLISQELSSFLNTRPRGGQERAGSANGLSVGSKKRFSWFLVLIHVRWRAGWATRAQWRAGVCGGGGHL